MFGFKTSQTVHGELQFLKHNSTGKNETCDDKAD